MAAAEALAIPEIVGLILESALEKEVPHLSLSDKAFLYRCCLVDIVWKEEAHRLLWHRPGHGCNGYAMKTFFKQRPEVQQYYADKIQQTSLRARGTYNDSVLGVAFPILKYLDIKITQNKTWLPRIPGNTVSALSLRTDLLDFAACGGHGLRRILRHVPEIFPHVTSLGLIGLRQLRGSDAWELVSKYPALTHYSQGNVHADDKDIGRTLHHLAKMETLDSLWFGAFNVPRTPMRADSLTWALRDVAAPFRNLRQISLLYVQEEHIRILFRHLSNLRCCRLGVVVPTDKLLRKGYSLFELPQECSRLTDLWVKYNTYASLNWHWDPIITGSSLVRLARNCPELKILMFRSRNVWVKPFGTDTISDQTIEEFASLLPRLEHFDLDFRVDTSGLTSEGVHRSFLRHCKAIKSVHIDPSATFTNYRGRFGNAIDLRLGDNRYEPPVDPPFFSQF